MSAQRILYPDPYPFPVPASDPPHTIQAVTLPDGSSVRVWVLDPSRPRGRILVCHGYYASYLQVLGIADGLRRRGFQVLAMELRGHGERPGPCTLGVREALDGETIVRWAGSREGSRTLPTGLLGVSMGAAAMCQVAARVPEVRAVVVDSIYSRLFPVLRDAIRQQYHLPELPWAWVTWWSLELTLRKRLSAVDPIALAPRLRQPLLAIQGGEDRRVSPEMGRQFYERWAGPKEWWFEPGVAHVGMFTKHPEVYCDRVATFFDRTLA